MSNGSVNESPAFVLVHGAWHDGGTWDDLVPQLTERGHGSLALDLPGAGINAKSPESFLRRPLDSAAFATEPSPNAAVTQDERTEAVIAAVREASAIGNGEVVLVGHSLGGLTISAVAETIPQELKSVVFLTALMLPTGMFAGEITGHQLNAGSPLGSLLMANIATVGALRLDTASTDSDYLATVKATFYGDLNDEQFVAAIAKLHCDEPASVANVPSNVTADRFGTVKRHYIRCMDDMGLTKATQDLMVALVDEALGSRTSVHSMDTSHSPFYSQPAELAEILAGIAT